MKYLSRKNFLGAVPLAVELVLTGRKAFVEDHQIVITEGVTNGK